MTCSYCQAHAGPPISDCGGSPQSFRSSLLSLSTPACSWGNQSSERRGTGLLGYKHSDLAEGCQLQKTECLSPRPGPAAGQLGSRFLRTPSW